MNDSSFGRLIGVLVSPGATFKSIAQRPTWAVAMVVLIGLILVMTVLMFQRVDFAEMMRQQMAERGQDVPASMENAGGGMVGCYAAAGAVAWIAGLLILAALFLVFNLFGGQIRYVTSLSVLLHAMMPFAVSTLLGIPVILSRAAISMEEIKSGGLLPSSLGILAPEDASPRLLAFLTSFEFFTFWTLILLIIGYSLAARVSKKTATITVLSLWALTVLLRVGLAGFGPMGGAN
ncbi:MAG TPA: YIP1 family protein [Thermoanaerobaculia bacterium]|nr:YIP1 family protein [Thermoanaerobaculia bacterium]